MVVTHCFRDLNIFGPNNTPSPDLLIDCPPPPEVRGCFPFRRKVKVSLTNIFFVTIVFSRLIISITRKLPNSHLFDFMQQKKTDSNSHPAPRES